MWWNNDNWIELSWISVVGMLEDQGLTGLTVNEDETVNAQVWLSMVFQSSWLKSDLAWTVFYTISGGSSPTCSITGTGLAENRTTVSLWSDGKVLSSFDLSSCPLMLCCILFFFLKNDNVYSTVYLWSLVDNITLHCISKFNLFSSWIYFDLVFFSCSAVYLQQCKGKAGQTSSCNLLHFFLEAIWHCQIFHIVP